MSDAGDEILSRLLQEHADLDQQLEHFHRVGRVIGAVYDGICREGVPPHDALELAANWMECHLFDRVERMSGFGPDEDHDEDANDPEEHA